MDLTNTRDNVRDIGDIGEKWFHQLVEKNRILHTYYKYGAKEFDSSMYDYDFYLEIFGGRTVEIKYDNFSCNSNNFAVETRTRMGGQGISQYKKSGISISKADYWLFLQPSTHNAKDIAYFWLIKLENLKQCTLFNINFPDKTFNHYNFNHKTVLEKTVRYEKEVYAKETNTFQELFYVPIPLIQTECKAFGNIEGFNINFLK